MERYTGHSTPECFKQSFILTCVCFGVFTWFPKNPELIFSLHSDKILKSYWMFLWHKMPSSRKIAPCHAMSAQTFWTCSLIVSVTVFEFSFLCLLVAAKCPCQSRVIKCILWTQKIKIDYFTIILLKMQAIKRQKSVGITPSTSHFRLVLNFDTPREKNISLYVCKIRTSVQTAFWQKPLISIRVQMTKN